MTDFNEGKVHPSASYKWGVLKVMVYPSGTGWETCRWFRTERAATQYGKELGCDYAVCRLKQFEGKAAA